MTAPTVPTPDRRSRPAPRAGRADYGLFLALGAMAVCIVGAFLLMTRHSDAPLTPAQPLPEESLQEPFPNDDLAELRAEIRGTLEAFKQAVAAETVTEAQETALERAILSQEELISIQRDDFRARQEALVLEELLGVRDGYFGEALKREVDALEREAQAAESQGDLVAAADAWEAARDLQQRLNATYPASRHRSAMRAGVFEGRLRELAMRPLVELSQHHRERAEQRMQAGELEPATVQLEAALAALEQLEREHPDSRGQIMGRKAALRKELDALRAQQAYAAVDEAIAQAEARVGEGDPLRAADAYGEALVAWERFADAYPSDPRAARSVGRGLERQRELALNAPLLGEISARDTALDTALQQRDAVEAQQLLAQQRRALERLPTLLEGSPEYPQDLADKTAYLFERRQQLDLLHRIVDSQLRPLPGGDAATPLMADRETSQGLYALIKDENPSNLTGDALPVESVSRDDAQNFLVRLGWLLGQRVRLPTVAEYRTALGGGDNVTPAAVEQTSWHAGNSDRAIQPVATRSPQHGGFHDLLGNVAEWTSTPAEAGAGWAVFGGAARQSPARLATLPVEDRPQDSRNRYVGFRFVVEPLQASTSTAP